MKEGHLKRIQFHMFLTHLCTTPLKKNAFCSSQIQCFKVSHHVKKPYTWVKSTQLIAFNINLNYNTLSFNCHIT